VSAAIPNTEPLTIAAGDTVKWTKALASYPASDGWVLGYQFVSAGHNFAVATSASVDDHLAVISAAESAVIPPGSYDWRARVTKAGEVFTVASGRTTVAPAFGANLDARTQARRQLEAIEATLEGRASSATAEYEIAGRKLKYIAIPELLVLRDRLRADVAREDAALRMANGLAPIGRIFVRHR